MAVTGENLGKSDRDDEGGITISEMLIDGSDLGFNAERHTQFLKDDSLYFQTVLECGAQKSVSWLAIHGISTSVLHLLLLCLSIY